MLEFGLNIFCIRGIDIKTQYQINVIHKLGKQRNSNPEF